MPKHQFTLHGWMLFVAGLSISFAFFCMAAGLNSRFLDMCAFALLGATLGALIGHFFGGKEGAWIGIGYSVLIFLVLEWMLPRVQ